MINPTEIIIIEVRLINPKENKDTEIRLIINPIIN
jgi:hypothetical protein